MNTILAEVWLEEPNFNLGHIEFPAETPPSFDDVIHLETAEGILHRLVVHHWRYIVGRRSDMATIQIICGKEGL